MMQFFVYGRDRADALSTRLALLPDHWAYMRAFIPALAARGPTIGPDGRPTGSLHIVDLPDRAAAAAFAADDPLAAGGVFATVTIRRFRNLTGRTMWQFPADPTRPKFLFVGEAADLAATRANDPDTAAPTAIAAQAAYLAAPHRSATVILHGPLLGDDGETWRGSAMLIEADDPAAARALVAGDPAASRHGRSALWPWRFGGEENLRDLVAAP